MTETESIRPGAAERESMVREAMAGNEVVPTAETVGQPVSELSEVGEAALEPSEPNLTESETDSVTENNTQGERNTHFEALMNDPEFRRALKDKLKSIAQVGQPEKENMASLRGEEFFRYINWKGKMRREGEGIKADYPEFDLDRTLSDRRVRVMLKSGLSLREAYEAVNVSGIIAERNRRLAESISQRSSRPTEGGASSQYGSLTANSVSRLTRDERESLARRAIRGESIILKN